MLGWMRRVSGSGADDRGDAIPNRRAPSSSSAEENLVEGLPDDLFNIRFKGNRAPLRKLAAALAQLCNVGLSRNRMLKTECSRRSIA
jgi:hypothetical protein